MFFSATLKIYFDKIYFLCGNNRDIGVLKEALGNLEGQVEEKIMTLIMVMIAVMT
jgi:hypothetical protein